MKKTAFLLILFVLCPGCGADDIECTPGETSCNDNVYTSCVYGKKRTVKCEGAAPVCDPKIGCRQPVQVCGNATIESGEECDTANLAGKSCADFVPGSVGTLLCTSQCTFDLSHCQPPESVCSENDKKCQGANLMRCENNAWIISTKCDDFGMICSPQALICTVGCSGNQRCSDDGKSLIKCENGLEVIQDCTKDGQTCTDGSCV